MSFSSRLGACALLLSFAFGGAASAQGYGYGSNPYSHTTQGYTNQYGTYVQPHEQTNPNGTQYDNYSTRGNYNPYTGRTGTRTPKW
jgi:hypothetical protein